ncbi:putative membrane protein [Bradyrhizobium ottawaense]
MRDERTKKTVMAGLDGRRAQRPRRSPLTRFLMALPAAAVSFVFSSVPALADLKICNRMSYVVEAAIGIDDKAATATRGWFRVDPATCRVVVQGTLTADRILLNARALGVYGASPIPQNGSDMLCVAQDNFVIAAARQCRSGQTQAAFTQVTPAQGADGNLIAYLAEDSEYDDEQARLAGIQRLLVIAGYDAAPIDGVDGPKTQAALAAFLKSRGLSSDIVGSQNFFKTMVDAVQTPSPTGLTWCNDTPHKVMAAIATDDGKSVTSRGWYRIDPKTCLHPDVTGQPKQIFSFAEAVDADNRAVKLKDRPLNWGGDRQLCTRETKFETVEQTDCGARGFAATGFGAVDMSSGGKTLRFAVP